KHICASVPKQSCASFGGVPSPSSDGFPSELPGASASENPPMPRMPLHPPQLRASAATHRMCSRYHAHGTPTYTHLEARGSLSYDPGVYELGTLVAGKYRIDSVLGQGGMGVVVGATHLTLGTPVALKILHPDLALQPAIVERFLREARASAQLRSEN